MKSIKSWYANIWIAGDYAIALDACRRFVNSDKTCVTVTKTDYVYTGGMQSGVCVRMIQYPKFPTEVNSLERQAMRFAVALRDTLHQQSFSIEFPDRTIWHSAVDSGEAAK